MVLLITECR